jgi:hypothetical protein
MLMALSRDACFFQQDDPKRLDFSLPNTAFLNLLYQIIKTIQVEGGRRQEAGGRRNNWERIQTPPMLFAPSNGGVLNPRPVRSRLLQRAVFLQQDCPLPPAFLDKGFQPILPVFTRISVSCRICCAVS